MKLLKVTAYCLRFIHNLRVAAGETTVLGRLSTEENDRALIRLVSIDQHQHFSEELVKLIKGQNIPKNSRIMSLNPYLDGNKRIRVGGR